MRNILIYIAVSILFNQNLSSQNLQNKWPENGPKLLFEIGGLGNGYSSPAVLDNLVLVTGEIDSIGYLFAYDLIGNLKWKTSYGYEWAAQYPGTRSAPTVEGNLVYVLSGIGKLSCFGVDKGDLKWSVDLVKDFEIGRAHV
jgi:outer membrane protein assembly factor BamB